MKPPRAPAAAFTLIELLSVVAVVGILAAILIPVVGAVRTKARTTQGLSNLRQLSLACITYAEDHRGLLPYSWENDETGRNFNELVAAHLYKVPAWDRYGWLHYPLFRDPLLTDRNRLLPLADFSANAILMPDLSRTGPRFPLDRLREPGRKILLFDAAVTPAGWSYHTGRGVPDFEKPPGDDAGSPIEPGDGTELGHFGWRHRSGTAAKVGFADGHVALLVQSEITKGMLQIER
jgi:prepilin-type N-terminal cleavage/methylation domain-containing protein/prepilin-type processing-associated H-X9-DG protein